MTKKEKKLFEDNPHFKEIISKLLSYGDFDIEKFSFTSNWYHKYEWTKGEENHFRKWLTAYLKNKEAWTELVEYPAAKTPVRVAKAVNEVILQWGWKSK